MLAVSDAWKSAYPGAHVGVLAMREVVNPDHHAGLDQRKADLENRLREQFPDRAAIKSLATIQAYEAYYKRFKKTYHVQLQLESVALKGKTIPRVSALVEAMFIAELKNQLLTAGHDLATIQQPVRLDIANGSERYTLLAGQEQELKPGDMFIADRVGVISSVIHGPDQRTRIQPTTTQVLFTVYAPPGISQDAMAQHLKDIQTNVQSVAPQSRVELSTIYSTG
jgi:DNA/RNA-binding domain of Phe-tRNA-synthetase-like protein